MVSESPLKVIFVLVFISLLARSANDRLASSDEEELSSSAEELDSALSLYYLMEASSSVVSCEQMYEAIACSRSVFWSLWLVVLYACLASIGAQCCSIGTETLLGVLGFRRRYVHLVEVTLDAIFGLVTGLSESEEMVQNQILIGFGSNVMLLTLVWGSFIILGKSDLVGSTTIDARDTKWFSFRGSGVSTDIWTSYAAMIMTMSAIPIIIIQVSRIFFSSSWRRLADMFSIGIAVALLLFNCLYQFFQPHIHKERLASSKYKLVVSATLTHFKKCGLGKFHTDDGKLNVVVVKSLFCRVDLNRDRLISVSELKALMIKIQIEDVDLDRDDAAQKVLADFDTSGDTFVNEDEFIEGISKWLSQMENYGCPDHPYGSCTLKLIDNFHMKIKEEYQLLGDMSNDVIEGIENPRWAFLTAIFLFLFGTAFASAFLNFLVDAVNNFSAATDLPSSFIFFIALPLATNASEALSKCICMNRKKKKRTASLIFTEIYGTVTVNNIVHLFAFFILVYARNLSWDFSSDELIVLIVCMSMGLFASFRTVFPLWTFSVAYVLYAFSLMVIYVLNYILGWSQPRKWKWAQNTCVKFLENCFT
ncbi:hypothetical protein Syun_008659 [Stephania yunnanensis]|uniref:EF-hand domain-containing protein n=1 Tax=Stephania yunnanensis TaxID=152371 RepID=A0AAP0KE74_9MAGN